MITKREEIEKMITALLPREEGLEKRVIEAGNAALLNGGKRLRPLILWESARVFSKEIPREKIAPFLAAMEMIHTFSLIHDDLPAMDNDRLRRGQPTTWVRFGEDAAILAGDLLSIEAFQVMARAMEEEKDPDMLQRMLRANGYLARAAGTRGMIAGQAVDMEYTGREISKEVLSYINSRKTGALMKASFAMGAILGGADKKQLALFEEAGEYVGEAFQIRDDMLDQIADEKSLGKPVHSDEKNQKCSYAALYGLKESGERVEALSKKALALLQEAGGDTTALKEIIVSLTTRKS